MRGRGRFVVGVEYRRGGAFVDRVCRYLFELRSCRTTWTVVVTCKDVPWLWQFLKPGWTYFLGAIWAVAFAARQIESGSVSRFDLWGTVSNDVCYPWGYGKRQTKYSWGRDRDSSAFYSPAEGPFCALLGGQRPFSLCVAVFFCS